MVEWIELRPNLYKSINLTLPISVYKKLDRDKDFWFFSCIEMHIHNRKLRALNLPMAKFEAQNILIEKYTSLIKELNNVFNGKTNKN